MTRSLLILLKPLRNTLLASRHAADLLKHLAIVLLTGTSIVRDNNARRRTRQRCLQVHCSPGTDFLTFSCPRIQTETDVEIAEWHGTIRSPDAAINSWCLRSYSFWPFRSVTSWEAPSSGNRSYLTRYQDLFPVGLNPS